MSQHPSTLPAQVNPVTSLRVGTRGSALALWQARHVQNELNQHAPDHPSTLAIITSEGDIDKVSSLTEIGGRGVFSSALQRALLEHRIDLAVHSTKDVPTLSPPGLTIAAFPRREDGRDVLVSRHGTGIAELPAAPVIGTSSRRRAVQILELRPDAIVVELRGNIDTRLRKAASEDYDAVILAAAGLLRMGWGDRITELLPIDRFTPSPGQGALAIETRIPPDTAHAIVQSLNDPFAALEVSLERMFLRSIGGGCTTPVGAHATLELVHGREIVRFWAMLASDDGSRLERAYDEFPAPDSEQQVRALAQGMMRALVPSWNGKTVGDNRDDVLQGKLVLVTGTPSLGNAIRHAFEERAATVTYQPTIEIGPSSSPAALEQAAERLRSGSYDWIVITSQHAVKVLERLLAGVPKPPAMRIAAVGASTSKCLNERGIAVDVFPVDDQRVSGLLDAMRGFELCGSRVLCLLGNRARVELAVGLRRRGARVDIVEAYRTENVTSADPDALALVRSGRVDIVTFGSPSSVESLGRMLGADLAALSGACLVALGPTTAQAMEDASLTAHVIAAVPDAPAVVNAVHAFLAGNG